MYEALIGLYPRRVREEFGDEMFDVFCQTLEDAKRRGRGAVARIWIRELATFPAALLGAYRGEKYAAAAAAIAASLAAGHLITNAGLFHLSSWYGLALGLSLGGLLFGAGSPRWALLVTTAALVGALAVDRALLQPGQQRTVRLPGVSYDVASSDAALANIPKVTSRVRVETYANGVITVVRTGGVDGVYVLVAFALLTGSAAVGRRLVAT